MSQNRTRRVLARTAQAFAPHCDKSWFRVTLPSGEVVTVTVLVTRGERNSVAVLEVDAPKGARVLRGEELKEVAR